MGIILPFKNKWIKLKKKIKCEVFTPDSVHSDHSALVFAITEAFLEVYDFDPDSWGFPMAG